MNHTESSIMKPHAQSMELDFPPQFNFFNDKIDDAFS